MSRYIRHPGYAAWKFSRREIQTILDKLIPGLAAARSALRADCIVVSGTSGSWLGAALTLHQELPVILVRKPDENSHGFNVEGPGGAFRRAIFLDDLVSSGSTLRSVMKTLDNAGTGVEVVGVVVYKPDSDGDNVRTENGFLQVRQWGYGFDNYVEALPVDHSAAGISDVVNEYMRI